MALITDAAGLALSADERAFFRDADPWGFIIFKRNVETPDQLRALTDSMRESVGRDAPILVDQEGGRVQRLGPPHWPKYPPGAALRRTLRAGRGGGSAGRLARRAADRARPLRGRHRCRLPAARRPAGERGRSRDRKPGVRTDAGAGCRDRRSGRRGIARGRRAAGAQAHPGAWARDRRQPPRAPGREHGPRDATVNRFRRVPPARQTSFGYDRACCVYRDRPRRARHHFSHNGARSDSRSHRIRRRVDE